MRTRGHDVVDIRVFPKPFELVSLILIVCENEGTKPNVAEKYTDKSEQLSREVFRYKVFL